MTQGRDFRPLRQNGMTLVAVLWVLAALSIVAASLAGVARVEIRGVQAMRDTAQLVALADAAVQLASRAVAAMETEPSRSIRMTVQVEGRTIPVEVTPFGGLLNINLAPESLLADALIHLGGSDPAHAAATAARIVESRQPSGAIDPAGVTGLRSGPFVSAEDLMQVEGLDYLIFGRIRPFIVTEPLGDGKIAPLAAPEPLLRVLARGDQAVAARIGRLRDAGEPIIDTTQLVQAHVGTHVGQPWRVQAQVVGADRRVVSRSAFVRISADRQGRPRPVVLHPRTDVWMTSDMDTSDRK